MLVPEPLQRELMAEGLFVQALEQSRAKFAVHPNSASDDSLAQCIEFRRQLNGLCFHVQAFLVSAFSA